MQRRLKNFINLGWPRGDTMIEVIVAISFIASALGLGYALSNRSLSNGLNAAQRSEALALAQGQVEFIKTTTSKPPPDIKVPTEAFCFSYNGDIKDVEEEDGDRPCDNYIPCNGCDPTSYNMQIDYNFDTHIFTTAATWASKQEEPYKLQLYYKLPGGGGSTSTGSTSTSTGSTSTSTGSTSTSTGSTSTSTGSTSTSTGSTSTSTGSTSTGSTSGSASSSGCGFNQPNQPPSLKLRPFFSIIFRLPFHFGAWDDSSGGGGDCDPPPDADCEEDFDHDGIPNCADTCPWTPGIPPNGCPDGGYDYHCHPDDRLWRHIGDFNEEQTQFVCDFDSSSSGGSGSTSTSTGSTSTSTGSTSTSSSGGNWHWACYDEGARHRIDRPCNETEEEQGWSTGQHFE